MPVVCRSNIRYTVKCLFVLVCNNATVGKQTKNAGYRAVQAVSVYKTVWRTLNIIIHFKTCDYMILQYTENCKHAAQTETSPRRISGMPYRQYRQYISVLRSII